MNTRQIDKPENNYCFSSYGVKIALSANSAQLLGEAIEEIIDTLPLNPKNIPCEEAEHFFRVEKIGDKFRAIRAGKLLDESERRIHILKMIQNEIRYAVSEYAVSRVFIHAGAVSIGGKGIIFPAQSFKGKSTLTAEFVKAGAVYFSDDLAVLDENALLHPFPKPLSMRGIAGDYEQVDIPVDEFGGTKAVEPVEVKMVILTEFEKGEKWSPEYLSPGNAVMEILPHTVPIRFNPKFTLNVLHKLVRNAIIAKSRRGDAESLVQHIFSTIGFFDRKPLKQQN